MGNGFEIDPQLLKGKMQSFYDAAKKTGGKEDEFDCQEDYDAFKNSVMTAAQTAKVDAGYKDYLGFNDDDVNAIFGLEKSAAAKSNQATTNPIEGNLSFAHVSPEDVKSAQKALLNDVKELVSSNYALKAIVPELLKKHPAMNRNEYEKTADGQIIPEAGYASSIAQVKEILDALGEDSFSVADGKELKKFKESAVAQFKKATGKEPTKFQKEVIESLTGKAESTAIGSKSTDYANRMLGKLASNGHNYEKAVNEIKEELKKKGADKKSEWGKDFTEEAFKELEIIARKDAQQYVLSYMQLPEILDEIDKLLERGGENLSDEHKQMLVAQKAYILKENGDFVTKLRACTSKEEIRTLLREKLKASDDSYISQAIQDVKSNRKRMARANNSNNAGKENISSADMKSELKDAINDATVLRGASKVTGISGIFHSSTKSAEKLMARMRNNSALYNPETDTYNTKEIAEQIISAVGYDFVMNRNDGDENGSELELARRKMGQWLYGPENWHELRKDETKALARIAKVELESRDRSAAYIALGIPGGAATGAAAGAVAGYLGTPRSVYQHQVNEWVLSANSVEEAKQILLGMGQKEEAIANLEKTVDGKFRAYQYQRVDRGAEDAGAGAINGAIVGAIVAAITRAIFGGDKHEKTCIDTNQIDLTDKNHQNPEYFKEYVVPLLRESASARQAMREVVDYYVKCSEMIGEKDKWLLYLKTDLEKAGGNGTINPEECITFFSKAKLKLKDIPQQENCDDKFGKEEEKGKFEPRKENFAHWDDCGNGYECLNGISPKLKNRMGKVMQAIDATKVTSEADIKKLYNIKSIAKFAQDTLNHGVAYAIKNNPELPIIESDFRAALGGAPTKGKTFTPDLYDENGNVCKWVSPHTKAKIQSGTVKGANIGDKSGKWNKTTYYRENCRTGQRTAATEQQYLNYINKNKKAN